MTRTDRRHRIRNNHTVPEVMAAIETAVFEPENRAIMHDLFVGGLTYEQTAERANLSVRGLYKRVGNIAPNVERQLNKLN